MIPEFNDFAAFILSHGRPDRVITYDTLRRSGYTGPIYIIVDDLDDKIEAYRDIYGEQVIVFDKKVIAETFDQGDNFGGYISTSYARNAFFNIAPTLGVKYFIQLDDDYRHFQFRFNNALLYQPRVMRSLDGVFAALLKFLIGTNIQSIAIAQGGDFIGGEDSAAADKVRLTRKCMNSFLCAVDRPFQFIGRMNEDVNTYVRWGSTGTVFFTLNQVTLEQVQTQSNAGGMTELYRETGTYVKSFYSVMYQPSSVKIRILRDRSTRLHHGIDWKTTVPKILSERWKKGIDLASNQ